MGVPREISQMRADQNFLFLSNTETAPGQYDAVKPLKNSPSSLFGRDTTKPRVAQKQSPKEKLDDFLKGIILEPSHITNKRRNANLTLETFESMKHKKQSYFFTSNTERKGQEPAQADGVSPFSYDPHRSKDILNRRKDFALKVPQGEFSPTREMSFLKKSPSQEIFDEFDQPVV